jgi:hypothetical protein
MPSVTFTRSDGSVVTFESNAVSHLEPAPRPMTPQFGQAAVRTTIVFYNGRREDVAEPLEVAAARLPGKPIKRP